MASSERTRSVWKATHAPMDTTPLTTDAEADVAVVGAGIAGLSVAYQLARGGARVLVLDDGSIGGGETGQTTAHLASALDDRFHWLEKIHGLEAARRAYESHARAIDEIEATCAREGIDCDFVRLDGFLFLTTGDERDTLEKELASARRIGVPGVELLERGAPGGGPCLRFPRQGQFHPLRYLAGLARAIERLGGRIHTGTRAEQIVGGEAPRVEVAGGPVVRARDIVVATNSPFHERVRIHSKQAPYRTFVVALRLPPGSVPRALFWDTGDPYHYVRTQPDGEGELLIVGGEDHRTGEHDDADVRYRRLEAWTRVRFPAVGEVVHRWSGQVYEPFDGLAFIGRSPDDDRVLLATGDSGQGMTHGTIAGLLLADLLLGRPNPWVELYDPARKTLRAAAQYVGDNAPVVLHYLEWLSGGDVRAIDDVTPGEGAVVRQGLRKLAVYRDEAGAVTVCSATCTHLGCIVHWNGEEKSWDCPCHGSRYSPTGDVLNGPAPRPLEAIVTLEPGSTLAAERAAERSTGGATSHAAERVAGPSAERRADPDAGASRDPAEESQLPV